MNNPDSSNVMEGLQEEDDDALYLFGRDVSKVACFKDSFLTGIYAGIGSGVLTFLSTSRPRPATHVSVGTFTAVSIGYWFICRSYFSQAMFQARQSESSFPEEIETVMAKKKKKEEKKLENEQPNLEDA